MGMQPGYQGTFVISWAQTEVDGMVAAPLGAVCVGASWRYSGAAVQVDGPRDLLILKDAAGDAERRRSAAHKVRRLLGAAISGRLLSDLPADDRLADQSFTLTDGIHAYVATVIEAEAGGTRLLMFSGRLPCSEADLWVVDRAIINLPVGHSTSDMGVICFTPDTMIDTPLGRRPVQDLRPGDWVSTQDDGAQKLLWVGGRRMTGARLLAMPSLRPIRIRAGAFGLGRPDEDLIVSPYHRMLVCGAAARALFNEPEVLVRACDLVNGGSVRIEERATEAHYIHLMFETHQVIRANGFETESFHPGAAALNLMPDDQRATLIALFPEVQADPMRYGAYARRALSGAQAHILRHDLAA
jgi:hypothetical protein